MVCYAVAVAGAQVPEEHLRKYLTPAAITAPITAYLQAKWPQAQVQAHTYGDSVNWTITAAGQSQQISVANGSVSTTNYQRNQTEAQALATEIQQALTAIGGAYWQNETYQYLAATYQVTESQRTSDGNLVVRLRV